jgi:hypothetical protein
MEKIMKKILLIVLTTTILFGWEINTHRAIDREAIAKAINLNLFLQNNHIKEPFDENSIQFDSYGMTYIKYILSGEKDGMSK